MRYGLQTARAIALYTLRAITHPKEWMEVKNVVFSRGGTLGFETVRVKFVTEVI